MSVPFSLGDVLALSKLIEAVIERCKSASKDFTDLQSTLHGVRCTVESAHYSISKVYENLPTVHKNGIDAAFSGIRSVIDEIAQELDQYSWVRPENDAQMSKLQFADVETKLMLPMTSLNICMGAIAW